MRRHTSLSLWLFIAIILFLWVLAGWNTYNFDYDNYSARYRYVQSGGFNLLKLDFGYDFIEYIFILFGSSFEQFRIWIYGMGLFIIGIIIWKWSIHPVWVLFFYICTHYLRDVVETRNFLASIFILLTIFHYGRKKPAKYLLIALLIFCAFSIHMSFFLYIPFLMADIRKWNYWALMLVSVLLSLFARELLSNSVGLFELDGMDDKVSEFLTLSPTFAFIAAVVKIVVNGMTISYFHSKALKACNQEFFLKKMPLANYSQIMYNLNSLSCILLILTPISGSFYTRLFGNILLLNAIYFFNVIGSLKRGRTELIVILLLYTVFFTVMTQINPFWEHLNFVLSNNALLFN